MSQQPPEDGSADSAEQAGPDPNVLREPAMRELLDKISPKGRYTLRCASTPDEFVSAWIESR